MAVLVTVSVLLLGFGVLALLRPASTAPFTDARGEPVPGSIAVLEHLRLGGVEQSVLIRGLDVRNPVLLFLHGGPGTSELGLVRTYNLPALERHFTVVVWDQRGAAKSFAARQPEHAMTVEQLVCDACELVQLLCRRFGQERLYLAGHSWGSALGMLTAQRVPERLHAVVGIGQVVHMQEGERVSYAWTLAQAQAAGDRRSVRTLQRLGAPPYTGDVRASVVAQRAILARYGGEVHGNRRGGLFILLRCLFVSEYSWRDRLDFFRGIFASMRLLWPQLLRLDLEAQVPELPVPVYFLLGRHDLEAPSVLAERYLQALRARRKTLVWFERSAHFLNAEEPAAFNAFFVERLLRETRTPAPGAAAPRAAGG